jgi:4-amino-4-deoxy-L-arabinose transferase-like glycosyltransferase
MIATLPTRALSWWPVFPVLLVASVVYFHAFGETPIYLGGDEARFATEAASIASSGRNVDGERLPLFFHMPDSIAANDGSTRWYQPVLFYLVALVLTVLPLSEASVRLPTALIGILDILLMFVVARRLFRSAWYGAMAAALLALAPAHLIFSRQALDYICLLPFVLGWLVCLTKYMDIPDARLALLGGLLLGVGFYSYIAAWILMPACLVLTWVVQVGTRPRAWRAALWAAAGFAVPLLALAPWLWTHPDMLRDTVGRYQVYDVRHLSALQGVKDFLNYNNVQERISVYWDYFNPAYLFFAGGSNLTTATRRAGVFLVPMALFLVVGLYDLWQRRREPISLVLLAGLAMSPLPATLVDERYAVQRALLVLPFGVLIGVVGIARLLRQSRRRLQFAAAVLLLSMPIEFAYFAHDYFTAYRVRSATWFDPIDFRDVAEYLIREIPTGRGPAVYFSQDLDDVAPRWRFYMAKYGRGDLAARTHYFSIARFDMTQVPGGSLIVFYGNDPNVPALVASGTYSVAKKIVDVAGGNSATILRKQS